MNLWKHATQEAVAENPDLKGLLTWGIIRQKSADFIYLVSCIVLCQHNSFSAGSTMSEVFFVTLISTVETGISVSSSSRSAKGA